MVELRKAQDIKYSKPETYYSWPFTPLPAAEPKVDVPPKGARSTTRRPLEAASGPLEAPSTLPPPVGIRIKPNTLVVGWEAQEGRIGGYELQVTDYCPIDGAQPKVISYRGQELQHTLSGLLPLRRMTFRVRAFDGSLSGQWSDSCVLTTLAEPPKPEPVPVTTLPRLWVTSLDVNDLLKYEEKRTGASQPETEAQLLACLQEHLATLKVAYRFYTLQSASSSTDTAPNSLGMGAFVAFAKAVGMPGKQLHAGQLIFTRAVRAVRAGGTIAEAVTSAATDVRQGKMELEQASLASSSLAVGSSAPAKGKQGRGPQAAAMEQHQFVGGVVRLAAMLHQSRMQNGMLSLVGALSQLLSKKVAPHVAFDLDLQHDAFKSIYHGQLMRVVEHKHSERLHSIFRFYATLERSQAKASTGCEAQTMDIKEVAELCAELQLVDASFGVRELVASFVRVNIDDEIYGRSEGGNTPSELVFAEFCELLARIFEGREWRARPQAERETEGELGLIKAYHAWLSVTFLPTAEAAIKARRRKAAKA